MNEFNKKGQIHVVGEGFLNLILGGMVLLIILFVAVTIYAGLTGSGVFTTPEMQAAIGIMDELPELVDWGFLFFFGGTVLASLVFFALREFSIVEYVFSWLYVFIFSFIIFIAGHVAQLFYVNPAFSSLVSRLTFMSFFIDNNFLFAIIYLLISLLAMHTPRS